MGKFRVFNRMKELLSNKYLILLMRLILGIIFIYASIDKIQNPAAFSDTIDNFHISPIPINNLLALFIPWIELIMIMFNYWYIYIRCFNYQFWVIYSIYICVISSCSSRD